METHIPLAQEGASKEVLLPRNRGVDLATHRAIPKVTLNHKATHAIPKATLRERLRHLLRDTHKGLLLLKDPMAVVLFHLVST
jgi:hypothetical protein